MTQIEAKNCDVIIRFLSMEHNNHAFLDRISKELFLGKKNIDQIQDLIRLIEKYQPKEVIRVEISEDGIWGIQGTGILLDFISEGGMKAMWEKQKDFEIAEQRKKQEKEKREKRAQELEIELKEQIIEDYPKTKARAKRSENIAIVSIIIAALSVFKDFILSLF